MGVVRVLNPRGGTRSGFQSPPAVVLGRLMRVLGLTGSTPRSLAELQWDSQMILDATIFSIACFHCIVAALAMAIGAHVRLGSPRRGELRAGGLEGVWAVASARMTDITERDIDVKAEDQAKINRFSRPRPIAVAP